jgi:hypothetical protein
MDQRELRQLLADAAMAIGGAGPGNKPLVARLLDAEFELRPENARDMHPTVAAYFAKQRAAVPARLDADRTAKPKTELVAHVPTDGRCVNPTDHIDEIRDVVDYPDSAER